MKVSVRGVSVTARRLFGRAGAVRQTCDDARTLLGSQRRVLESLPSKSFPDTDVLIVVRSSDTALYERLLRTPSDCQKSG
jgi:hypothetical protein